MSFILTRSLFVFFSLIPIVLGTHVQNRRSAVRRRKSNNQIKIWYFTYLIVTLSPVMQNTPTYPLTKPQVGIFLHFLKNPDSTQYNLPVLVEIPSDVDAEMLCAVMRERISGLSTVFTRFVTSDDGSPLQFISEPKLIEIERLEMSEADFANYKKQGMIRPFNLFDKEPLARISFCKTESSRYLITDIHHIICDGWSLNMLFQLTAPLAPFQFPPVGGETSNSLADSITHKSMSNGSLPTEKWFGEGFPFADISIQTDKRSGRQVRCSETMDKSTVDTWCKEHGVTANDFFMATFCVVMSRLTRLNDMGFYTMSHGRTKRILRNVVGMFVRSVPMLARINWSNDSLALMKDLHKEHLSALRRSKHFTMAELCKETGMRPAAYFNFLGWERMRESLIMENGTALPAIQPCRPSVDDNLGVEIYLNGSDYEIRCQSSEALNPEPIVSQVANSIKLVAQRMMLHPTEPLKSISLTNEKESALLMELGKGEAMDFNPDDTFLSLFRRQAQKTPDAIAVVDRPTPDFDLDSDFDHDSKRQTTYAELLAESYAIAEQLRSKGTIMEGDSICNTTERNATFLAHRIAAEIVGTSHYIIYTSGSTGSPKGVMVSHRAKANLIQFIAKEWGLSERSRICCHSDFAFDASIEDLYPVLTVGGTLYIMPEEIRRDIDRIRDFIVQNGITGGCFTTQLGQMLLQRYPDLPMDYLVVGGERMTVAPDCRCKLINTYGPTEFTVDATYHVIDKNRTYETLPIGRPVANTSAYILDDCLQLLPKGMTGELCLSGVQMAEGYVNDKALTDKKFVVAPFGKKVYRTGDLARWNERGELEYIGRTDSQLKIRGYRVEPAEIEARMAEHPRVLMQSVMPFKAAGDTHLCAYYVADGELSAKEMKDFLAALLSDYKVPSAYMQLKEMPLTQSGKVDAKRLPTPKLTGNAEYAEPEEGLEQQIAAAFAKVLGLERVGANDDFFTIGGTSLNAIGVVVELERQGVKIALNDLFKHKTPRALNNAELKEMQNAECRMQNNSKTDDKAQPNSEFCILHSALKKVILLGSTGFLGIHILQELLTDPNIKHIVCPVRRKDGKAPATRLKETYKYYFDSDLDYDLDSQRLKVVDFDSDINLDFDICTSLHPEGESEGVKSLIINCLANVKHFASDGSIMETNVETVRRLIDFCLRTQSHLVHISTISIAGIASKQRIAEGLTLSERDYDIGQSVDFNEYIKSKFIAEGLILDAVCQKGLSARIMRVGNLGARSTDGQFQANPESNAFHSALQAISMLSCVPESTRDLTFDLSPVDITAKAITKLMSISDTSLIFHPFNSKPTSVSDIVSKQNSAGNNISIVTDSDFMEAMEKAKQDPQTVAKLHSLLAYQLPNSTLQRVPISNTYTTKLLKELGVEWGMMNGSI